MTKSAKSANNGKAKAAQRPSGPEAVRSKGANPSARNQTNGRKKGSASRPDTKLARLIELLRREEGATISQLTDATGWQAHSVRGAISGTIKKKLGLAVASEKVDGRGRVYHIAAGC